MDGQCFRVAEIVDVWYRGNDDISITMGRLESLLGTLA
ncbi:hypothetical protein N007_02675 [Alicyclobacillus acidoterrestris ATCC 49025]|nr:hypothetical protein N007_02675 [Alicyclobacillus acidoterrestris ATCC 49025]